MPQVLGAAHLLRVLMSSHPHIYFGPYVECTYKPATRTEKIRGCTNKECSKHPKKVCPDVAGAFCAACGSPNDKIPITVKAYTSHYDVVKDELFEINSEDKKNRDVLWLAPNSRRPGDPRPDFGEGEIHLDLVNAEPEQEMAWFMTAYAKELRKLEAAYATVTVKWGLHRYRM
jgi:hypothetical protein